MSAAMDQAVIDRLAEQGDQPAPLFAVDPDTKVCACGEVFHRGERSRVEFASQRFHSRECAYKHRPPAELEEKPCAHCGQVFQRAPRLARAAWVRKQFCTSECRSAGMRARTPAGSAKTCETCGSEFHRRLRSENEARFATRRFCSNDCSARHRSIAANSEDDTRVCAGPDCDVVIRRNRAKEGVKAWAKHKHCSQECWWAVRRASSTKPPRPAPNPKEALPTSKTCVVCGAGFARRDGEQRGRWRTRELCSRACGAERARNAPRSTQPRPARPKPVPTAETVTSTGRVIPPKPDVPRVVWRPGMGEDGTGELAAGFAREVNVWAGVRR